MDHGQEGAAQAAGQARQERLQVLWPKESDSVLTVRLQQRLQLLAKKAHRGARGGIEQRRDALEYVLCARH